ncbi:MAG: hypothetical protein ACREQI_02555 [Candidatus Binataceae bacterium]
MAARDIERTGAKRGAVSHWIRLACEQGQRPEIDQKRLQEILDEQTLPSVAEQVDSLMLWLGGELLRMGKPNARVEVRERRKLTALVGASPQPENEGLDYLIEGLAQKNLTFPSSPHRFSIGLTFDGWQRYEDLKRARTESRLAFMAMPFGDALLDRLFSSFKEAVAETGFELRRIIDQPEAGLIDNRMRVEILKARFAVCELTKANAGAYWEGGFAEGIGRPVIYTCEKSHFEKNKTHFDTKHSHTVLWEESDLRAGAEQLKATIRATATLRGEAKLTDK